MHRAITQDGRAAAVKVQYPGIAETMAADLDNVALLRRLLRVTAPSQDVDALITELRDRVLEELDYRREAANQRLFAAYYDGHPTIHIPRIIDGLSSLRVVTSELSDGARFTELGGWPQEERDLAAETIYRFVFRSLYEAHAFNEDLHSRPAGTPRGRCPRTGSGPCASAAAARPSVKCLTSPKSRKVTRPPPWNR